MRVNVNFAGPWQHSSARARGFAQTRRPTGEWNWDGKRLMTLRDFIRGEHINLALSGNTKDEILAEMVASLNLPASDAAGLLRILQRREGLGSTGIGRGVAVPHCRTPLVPRLRVVFGRRTGGIPYDAIDSQPVSYFFMIVAPPAEASNDYLPVLGRIAQLAKEPDVPDRLGQVRTPAEFLALLSEKNV